MLNRQTRIMNYSTFYKLYNNDVACISLHEGIRSLYVLKATLIGVGLRYSYVLTRQTPPLLLLFLLSDE